jgi:glucose/arabinose dehydrogenase
MERRRPLIDRYALPRAWRGARPRGRWRRLGRVMLLAALALAGPRSALAAGTSLRFHGTGTGGIDRVTIALDGPARPVDVGATDFTLEWWMKTDPAENATGVASCGDPEGWRTGRVVFDRDVFGGGDFGDYGVALTPVVEPDAPATARRVAVGVSQGSEGTTLCGTADVADGRWHHVAVTREAQTGELRIYVDGILDAVGAGPAGDISYRDGRPTTHPDDPFLVIGAAKHDLDPAVYPSYQGWIDEVRLSTVRRYTGPTFTRPRLPFVPDTDTAALYHLDDGAADPTSTVVADSSGAAGGPSPGERKVGGAGGGAPDGPEWSTETPPLDGLAIGLAPVVSGLAQPVSLANAGDGSGRLYIVQQGGQIRVYEPGVGLLPTPFLDLAGIVLADAGERGLLGLAFHPRYSGNPADPGTTGYFYVHYTSRAETVPGSPRLSLAAGDVVIARYTVSTRSPSFAGAPSLVRADPASRLILKTAPHSAFTNHNGGQLAFGLDGMLFDGIGDGGGAGDPSRNAQNVGVLLGKLLRLDVDDDRPQPSYVPSDNPFVATPGARPEIWALGLRNPWRFAFDRATGDLFIADVGQSSREEIDLQRQDELGPPTGPVGRNYCWSRLEGSLLFNGAVPCNVGVPTLPILEYDHSQGDCAIIGGFRYRGTAVPTLHGVFVHGDFCSGRIWGAVERGTGAWTRPLLLDTGLSLTTFGEDEAGELYVADLGGSLYRLVPPVPATVQFAAAAYTVAENRGSVTLMVTRTGSAASPATVEYATSDGTATAGSDYTARVGTLAFGPGETTKPLVVPIADDCLAEGSETFTVTLSAPSPGLALGTPAVAQVTITDNDAAGTIQFSQSRYAVAENAGSATIAVTRTGGAACGVTVSYRALSATATAPGDFAAVTGTLTFGAGDTVKTFTVPIVDDGLAEGAEAVLLALTGPGGGATLGARQGAILTIVDNDVGGTLQFAPAAVSAGEWAGTATVTVARSGGAAGGVTVAWSVIGGTAVHGAPDDSGADYTGPTSGVLAFGPGVTSQSIPLALLNHAGPQGARTILVGLSQPTGGAHLGPAVTVTVTILDDEVGLAFSQSAYAASEASPAATITVMRSGPATAAVTVAYATGPPASGVPAVASGSPVACTPGADYRPVSGTLTFGPGQRVRGFAVPLCPDARVDGAKAVGLVLSAPSAPAGLVAGRDTAVLTIADATP